MASGEETLCPVPDCPSRASGPALHSPLDVVLGEQTKGRTDEKNCTLLHKHRYYRDGTVRSVHSYARDLDLERARSLTILPAPPRPVLSKWGCGCSWCSTGGSCRVLMFACPPRPVECLCRWVSARLRMTKTDVRALMRRNVPALLCVEHLRP